MKGSVCAVYSVAVVHSLIGSVHILTGWHQLSATTDMCIVVPLLVVNFPDFEIS